MDAELATVTLGELRAWAAGLWRRSYGRALVQGNVRPEEARAIVASVEQARPPHSPPTPPIAALPLRTGRLTTRSWR